MTTEKMTKKDYFETIKVLVDFVKDKDFELDGIDFDGVIEFCDKEIDALARKAEKAREAAAKKKEESDALLDEIYSLLSSEDFMTIVQVAGLVSDPEATVGKVQYRLGELVREGKAEKELITIPATETTKMRKVSGYRKVV